MNELQDIQYKNQFSDWQRTSAFNTYWQYSYLNREAFYANISAEYRLYMQRWVKNALWWYDGWVPYFHSNTDGIFSTRIASALVDGAAKKVIGGRIFYKNANKEHPANGNINKALQFISADWSKKTKFAKEIKRATTFAAAAGTSLLKLNKDNDGLWAEALRFDSFYPVVGARGKLLEVTCFLRNFTKLHDDKGGKRDCESFYVVEHRYFGEYTRLDGEVIKNAALVEYKIVKSTGSVVNGQNYTDKGTRIKFCDLPRAVKENIGSAYSMIAFDKPIILPFNEHLGAVLVNWTDGVSNLPELPFGDSLLSNITPYLQSWDYYFSAFNTDMYIGRGQVITPNFMQKKSVVGDDGYYAGKYGLMFTPAPGAPTDEQKPLPIQFDLRSTSWKEIRDMLMQNIAINTRMNISTIASFLQDTNGNKTAREISTEESETALFVDDKREIIERPINELLTIVLRFYGFTDDVVIRWSQAGLSNMYTRTEMIATARQSGFCSQYKAIQMFAQDDDEYQIEEEYQRCLEDDEKEKQQGSSLWNDQDYYGDQGEEVSNENSVQG